MKLPVYTRTGAEAGREVELDDAVFGLEPNDHAIWLDVRAIQAHMRQGTHKTKERAEVSRSTRKLYRQKGTGNARVGSGKSPTRKGGGTIFGPRPHEYNVRVNRKTKQLARRSALAHKITGGALRVLETFTLDAPKTRDIAAVLKSHGVSGRVLLLTNGLDETLFRSARNIPGVEVRSAAEASTLDLMGARTLILSEGAVEALTEALRPSTKPTAVETAEAPAAEAPTSATPTTDAPADDAPSSTDEA
jgi:large subunit ribosomal protein L4